MELGRHIGFHNKIQPKHFSYCVSVAMTRGQCTAITIGNCKSFFYNLRRFVRLTALAVTSRGPDWASLESTWSP